MKQNQLVITALSFALLFGAVGCNSENPGVKKEDSSSKTSGDGGNVHADGTVHKDHSSEGHAHAPGPHGGTIVDWGGGKFHVELTVDHDRKEATAYILGTDEKTPKPIDSAEITMTIQEPSFTMSLKPSPQTGDSEGKASRFVGTHESLETAREYEGSLSGVVDETPYSGNFKEGEHDH